MDQELFEADNVYQSDTVIDRYPLGHNPNWRREADLKKEDYKPRTLAIDEFAIHKGHSYATCLMDLDLGDIFWVGRQSDEEF